MTHTNLNTAPEIARQYLLSLLVPEGTLVEMDGEPVVQVLPLSPVKNGSYEGVWTPEKNRRRCVLVDLEIERRITPEEVVELRNLEGQLDRHLDKVAPLPLEALRKLHAELMEEATKKAGA